MQCFIPFSEELVEQHPELMNTALVPYCEEYMDYVMEFEVKRPSEAANMEITGFSGSEILKIV